MPRRPAYLDPAGIAALAGTQSGVLSRDQLAALGVSRGHVAHRVRTGRWQPVGPRVVALTTGPLSDEQRHWAAVLHAGPASALADLTAAKLGGLRGFEDPVVHVVVPHGSDARDLIVPSLGLYARVRQSRRLGEHLVQPAREPRRLALGEAVVDAAARAGAEARSRLLVIATVQQRLLRPEDLRRTVGARPKLRRRALILAALADVEGGIHSLPEREWSRSVRRHGLPEPVRQQRVRRGDGTWYLDADFDPWGVGVEIDGVAHLRVSDSERDDHRRNVLGTRGRLMITISSHLVRSRPGAAAVITAAALLARGWRPDAATRDGLRHLAETEGMDLRTGDWLRSPRRAS